MPQISSETRKAFVTNLHKETWMNLDQIKVVVIVLNSFENSFIQLFNEVRKEVELEFDKNYKRYSNDEDNYDQMRSNLNYIDIKKLKAFNYYPFEDFLDSNELDKNLFVQGIIDFLFVLHEPHRWDVPRFELLTIK